MTLNLLKERNHYSVTVNNHGNGQIAAVIVKCVIYHTSVRLHSLNKFKTGQDPLKGVLLTLAVLLILALGKLSFLQNHSNHSEKSNQAVRFCR